VAQFEKLCFQWNKGRSEDRPCPGVSVCPRSWGWGRRAYEICNPHWIRITKVMNSPLWRKDAVAVHPDRQACLLSGSDKKTSIPPCAPNQLTVVGGRVFLKTRYSARLICVGVSHLVPGLAVIPSNIHFQFIYSGLGETTLYGFPCIFQINVYRIINLPCVAICVPFHFGLDVDYRPCFDFCIFFDRACFRRLRHCGRCQHHRHQRGGQDGYGCENVNGGGVKCFMMVPPSLRDPVILSAAFSKRK